MAQCWERKSRRSRGWKARIKKIRDDILRIEKEKKDLLKLIDKKAGKYESLKNMTGRFDLERSRLDSIAALIKSKKNIFSTLYNMFDLEFAGFTKDADSMKGQSDQKAGSTRTPHYENILKELSKIDGLIVKFLEELKGKLKDKSLSDYVENEGRLIIGKLRSLYKSAGEGLKGKTPGSRKEIDDFKKRLDLIKAIKEICMINLKRSQKFFLIINDFMAVSEKIKGRLYPEFEKGKDLLSGNQGKIGELDGEINRLNTSRSDFENLIYKADLKKEQIKEKVKTITEDIADNYNLSMEYALKSYSPSPDTAKSRIRVRRLKNEIKRYGSVNPNAAIEYGKIKKRFDFLEKQKLDLVESGKNLEKMIKDINKRIAEFFFKKFDEINKCFRNYFKVLFPLGEGEMQLERSRDAGSDETDETGIDLKVDIGNNKFVPISLLSGGEKSLVSMAFLFSIYSINPSPFYVFDEVDAALDDVNIGRFLTLIKKFSEKQQIILITHQKRTMEIADTIYGVTMQSNGISKIVSEKIGKYAEVN